MILPISSLDLAEEYVQLSRRGQSINNPLTPKPLVIIRPLCCRCLRLERYRDDAGYT